MQRAETLYHIHRRGGFIDQLKVSPLDTYLGLVT